MSEAEYYWPLSGEVGIYDILTDKGQFYEWEWADGKWRCPTSRTIKATTEQMQKWGYLGVRREKTTNATPRPSKALTPDPDDANTAYAASVMTRLRAAKKPGEFERIALECVPVLCQMLGAE